MTSTGTRRPSHARLAVLEAQHAKRKPSPDEPQYLAEEEWLTAFRHWAGRPL
jgi:hypothetical protein